jgi:hypothetical protein
MRTTRLTTKSIALAVTLAALGGCAAVTSTPSQDDLLCAEARAQNRKQDPAWMATVDRIQDKHTAWYCINYLIAGDNGFIQGGP